MTDQRASRASAAGELPRPLRPAAYVMGHLGWLAISLLPLVVTLATIGVVLRLIGQVAVLFGALIAYAVGDIYIRLGTRGRPIRYGGVRVTATAEPRLHELVTNTLSRISKRQLDGIWLEHGAGAGALVGRRDWLLRRHVGLVLGFLTVAHLDEEHLLAVLAHEAGHFADRDRLRLMLVRRRYRVISQLHRRTTILTRRYWRWWLSATRGLAIEAERHADRVADALTSADAGRGALGRLVVLHDIHHTAINRLESYWDQGQAPTLITPFYESIRSTLTAAAVAEIWNHRLQLPDRPEDTHPGLQERGARLDSDDPATMWSRGVLVNVEKFDRACTKAYTRRNARHTLTSVEI